MSDEEFEWCQMFQQFYIAQMMPSSAVTLAQARNSIPFLCLPLLVPGLLI